MIIYNVETLNNYEIIKLIYEELLKINEIKAEDFYFHAIKDINHRWKVIQLAKTYIAIQYQDNTDYCLYCEEKITHKKGCYCDKICGHLHLEEIKEKKRLKTVK